MQQHGGAARRAVFRRFRGASAHACGRLRFRDLPRLARVPAREVCGGARAGVGVPRAPVDCAGALLHVGATRARTGPRDGRHRAPHRRVGGTRAREPADYGPAGSLQERRGGARQARPRGRTQSSPPPQPAGGAALVLRGVPCAEPDAPCAAYGRARPLGAFTGGRRVHPQRTAPGNAAQAPPRARDGAVLQDLPPSGRAPFRASMCSH